MTEVAFAYEVGELIECRDPATAKWREAYVMQLAPHSHRGRRSPGYYIQWHPLPKPSAENGFISPSSGGWTYEACMRRKQEAA